MSAPVQAPRRGRGRLVGMGMLTMLAIGGAGGAYGAHAWDSHQATSTPQSVVTVTATPTEQASTSEASATPSMSTEATPSTEGTTAPAEEPSADATSLRERLEEKAKEKVGGSELPDEAAPTPGDPWAQSLPTPGAGAS